MLKLFVHVKGQHLRVRKATDGESFNTTFTWLDALEIEVTLSSILTMTWTSLLPELLPRYAESMLELISARFPWSPHHETLKKSAPDLLFKDETDEWVFFGGSFNPWHQGHSACLKLLPVEKTLFIVPDRNPLKEDSSLDPVSSLIKLSFKAKIIGDHFLVPTFLLQKNKNPTVEWMEKLKPKVPNKKLSLLMGFDSLVSIPKWVRPNDLMKLLERIYVVSREENEQEKTEILKRFESNPEMPELVFLGHHPHEKISSTKLRKEEGA